MFTQALTLCVTLCILGRMTDIITPGWTLGDRLRKARSQAGIGSEQMATIIGASRGTISNYENDHTDIPVKAITKWATATGVPVSWLIHGDDPDLRSRCFSAEIDQLELFANTAAVAA
jgi:transcriptional regulator with XRE-family HTH domain